MELAVMRTACGRIELVKLGVIIHRAASSERARNHWSKDLEILWEIDLAKCLAFLPFLIRFGN
jgi:hypothetical protein